MKVPHSKELATHAVPESCVAYREVRREALTGARIGQPLSRDSIEISGADAVQLAEGNTFECSIASAQTTRRSRRPWHVRTLLVREPGGLLSGRCPRTGPTVRIGKVRSRSR